MLCPIFGQAEWIMQAHLTRPSPGVGLAIAILYHCHEPTQIIKSQLEDSEQQIHVQLAKPFPIQGCWHQTNSLCNLLWITVGNFLWSNILPILWFSIKLIHKINDCVHFILIDCENFTPWKISHYVVMTCTSTQIRYLHTISCCSIIYRMISLLSERATMEANHAAMLAQANNVSRELQRRLEEQSQSKDKVRRPLPFKN